MKTREEILQSLANWESLRKPVEMLEAPENSKQLWFKTDFVTKVMLESIAGENTWLIEPYGNGVVEVTIWY